MPPETVPPAEPEPVTVTAATDDCPQCLHAWHGRRVCRDANCCSCRLTWRDTWKAGYMQGWRDYPSALWRGFYPPTEVEMESDTMTDLPPVDAVVEVAFRGRVAAYNDDYNGTWERATYEITLMTNDEISEAVAQEWLNALLAASDAQGVVVGGWLRPVADGT